MGRKINAGSISTVTGLPEGYYDFRIASFEEAISRNTGLLMYKLGLRVVGPTAAAGKGYTENLVVGKRPWNAPPGADEAYAAYCDMDDPMGEDPITIARSSGLRTLKEILIAAEHPGALDEEWDMDEITDDLNITNQREQYRFGARVIRKEGKDGRMNNELTMIYKEGAQQARLDEAAKASTSGEKRQSAAQASRKNRTRRRVEEDED